MNVSECTDCAYKDQEYCVICVDGDMHKTKEEAEQIEAMCDLLCGRRVMSSIREKWDKYCDEQHLSGGCKDCPLNDDDNADAIGCSMNFAYQQGRADAETEHNAICETCIHKVSKEDIEQIRAEAVEESFDNCIELVKGLISTYDPFESWDDVGVNIVLNELHTLVSDFEQLKEQKE